jgi:hypothetical protein
VMSAETIKDPRQPSRLEKNRNKRSWVYPGGRSGISDAEVDDWHSSIDILLRRFAEYHDLEGAFGRRATIERARAA